MRLVPALWLPGTLTTAVVCPTAKGANRMLPGAAGSSSDEPAGTRPAGPKRPQPFPGPLEQVVMIGEDDVFLGSVRPEERGPAQTRAFDDVIDGCLLVSALVEQGECGFSEPVSRRWLAHDRPSLPIPRGDTTCQRRRDSVPYLLY